MNNEKHCSVIDAEGRHVTYVLVKIRDKPLEDGGTEHVLVALHGKQIA